MSCSKIEEVFGRVYFGPSWRENILHAAHHYTRYDINYRLGVMKKKIAISNIPLITPLGQHMIQTVVGPVLTVRSLVSQDTKGNIIRP